MTSTAAPEGHVAKLFGRDSLYMVLWGVQLVVAAVGTPAITRILGVGEFGTVTSANAVMQVLFVVAGLSLQSAVQREFAAERNPLGARRLVGFAMAVGGLICTAAWLSLGLWSGPIHMADETVALQWAVLWAGSSALTNVLLAMLRSQDRLLPFSVVSFLQSVFGAGAGLAAVALFDADAETFLAGQVGAQILAMIVGICLAPPALFRWRDRGLIDRALRFALPLVPSALSTFVLSTSDRLVIESLLGSEAVARYQVAYNVASMPMLLLTVLNTAWMPRFYAIADSAERRTVLAASRDALYRLMVPVLTGFALGSPLVMRVWAPASYRPDQLQFVIAIVLITLIPYAAQLSVVRTLMSEGRTVAIAVLTFLAAVVNLLLNFLLVPVLGLTGSALATLIAYVGLHLMAGVAGRGSGVAAPHWTVTVPLAAATALALGSAAVPETTATLVLRGVAAAGTVVWFLVVLREVGRAPEREPGYRGRHTLRALLARPARGRAVVPVRARAAVPARGLAVARGGGPVLGRAAVTVHGPYHADAHLFPPIVWNAAPAYGPFRDVTQEIPLRR